MRSCASWRLAASVAQPIGIPCQPVATDHFQPSFARSVGFGPVPTAAGRCHLKRAVEGDLG
jgi:hypothetical protein